MRTLELFCGTKSFSKVATQRGHDTFTVDIDPRFDPDLVADVSNLTANDLPKNIDVLWASPPCTCFPVASLGHYWTDGKPKNQKTRDAIALVEHTTKLINEINPKYWFIENPRAMLRKQDCVDKLPRKTITYCQYGAPYQKPTDVWTNAVFWASRPPRSPGDLCHDKASRGSKTGTQGNTGTHLLWKDAKRSAIARAVIPPTLFVEIFDAIAMREAVDWSSLVPTEYMKLGVLK